MTQFSDRHLARDLKALVSGLEDLLSNAADSTKDAVHDTRKQMDSSLRHARHMVNELEKRVASEVKTTARTTNRLVRNNPWQTIGIAAGVGVLIGLLLSGRER